MANIQTSFIDFHNSIRLDVEDNTLLKDYKDQVIDGLKDYLPDDVKFETFLQGSYSVYTGIKSCDEKIDFDSRPFHRRDCCHHGLRRAAAR